MIKQILYNCEADCTVLIKKPQVILGGGVRTPCTLPLDPPLLLNPLSANYLMAKTDCQNLSQFCASKLILII